MFKRCTVQCLRTSSRHASRQGQIRQAGTFSKLPTAPKVTAYILIGAGGIGLALGVHHYLNLPVSPYPEAVTAHIRKALYYEGAGADPKLAVQHYLDALEEATGLGLDQTSDAMTGLKIKIAGVYEQAGRLDSAIRVYAGLLNELRTQTGVRSEEDRIRLLKRAIGTSVKIGELASQVPGYEEKARPALTWALESALKETASRQQGGNLAWLGQEEMSSLFERVGHHYYASHQADLALPLFLKALETHGQDATCRTVMLMNNVASALSSSSTQLQVQENAKLWAERARDLKVQGDTAEMQAECAYGKLMAVFNLGRIAEQLKQGEDARRYYEQVSRGARSLSHVGARELMMEARSALDRIA